MPPHDYISPHSYPAYPPGSTVKSSSRNDLDDQSVVSSTPSHGVASHGSSVASYYTQYSMATYENMHRMPPSESSPPSEYSTASDFAQIQARNPPPPITSSRRLQCEFRDWINCQHTFGMDEVDQWIQHTEDEHLRGRYPVVSLCWFCEIEFNSQGYLDLGWNFDARMRHIAGHILEGDHFENRRPDFHVLNHVDSLRLISAEAFQREQGRSEGPPAPSGLYPPGWRPERHDRSRRIVEEARSSGRRHRNTRHYF
ncbi:hypothetical protein C8035_v005214 [Colletotrichum spinosum]|uniref:Uncharacterized protein n=1 Tax=Colletotrichum spinosum TaxID=1347390 RepID=A0A4R8PYZ7_9PEZI|nr:hypothetical protein C8035_v005214 [Colletotrichum spinosum]